MELIVVRHGLPERQENSDGTPADPGLSETGWEQARRVASFLQDEGVQRIYTSPMQRAKQTAEPLAELLDMSPSVVSGVAEFDRDAHFYIPVEELKQTDPVRFRALLESDWSGMFDVDAFQPTVVEAMEGIIADNPGSKVAVFCHGGVINVWAAFLLKTERPMFFLPHYTSVNRFAASTEGLRSVVSLNETAHLREPRPRT